MLLYYDSRGIVRVASTTPIVTNIYQCVEVDPSMLRENPLGRRVVFGKPQAGGLRLAVVCNWGDACGIATYSKYLVDALTAQYEVSDIKIFAEDTPGDKKNDGYNVEYCWKRGKSLEAMMTSLKAWHPSVVLIQHEFGIFPKAGPLLRMLNQFDADCIPYVITLHSVYEHLDKVVCTGAMKNIVVHSESGRDCLRRLGHTTDVEVIPHGCVQFDEVNENWNIVQTPYALIQFGFGFRYKGVDVALEAVSRLVKSSRKYRDMHYCYLCSENPHVRRIIADYFDSLMRNVARLGLQDNVAIIRGFQTEEVLNQYLRTYKMAIFPYEMDPRNKVYGASGAVRLAMANRIPTIVSDSPMFDDLRGVLPRPSGPDELAAEIDRLFSDHRGREGLVRAQDEYVAANTWGATARRYLAFLRTRMDGDAETAIHLPAPHPRGTRG